jgi:hypothetical protein
MMGALMLEHARRAGTQNDLLGPEVRSDPVHRVRTLERLPRRDQRSVRDCQEGAARRAPGLPRPVRDGHRLPDAGQSLWPARQF